MASVDCLASKGVDKDRILRQAMVTPSCGTGSMEPEEARGALTMATELSQAMRQKH
jgi:hypothetical protein